MSPSPPLFLRGIGPFQVPENAPFLWEVLLFLEDLLYESTVVPHREIGDKMQREIADLKLCACLILSEMILDFDVRDRKNQPKVFLD